MIDPCLLCPSLSRSACSHWRDFCCVSHTHLPLPFEDFLSSSFHFLLSASCFAPHPHHFRPWGGLGHLKFSTKRELGLLTFRKHA